MSKPNIFFGSIMCTMMFVTNLFIGTLEQSNKAMFIAGISFCGLIFIAYQIIKDEEKEFKENESNK